MATKEDGLFVKKQITFSELSKTDKSSQFLNFNLNQSEKCSQDVSAQFFSKTNNVKSSAKLLMSGYTVTEHEKRKSWNKSSKDLSFKSTTNPYSNSETKKEGIRMRWKNDKNDNSEMKNNSTLSLHIAAYENPFDVLNEKKDLIKKSVSLKPVDCFSNFEEHQDSFEFPRQLEGTKSATPQIMQFKASQKLLSPNQGISFNRSSTTLIAKRFLSSHSSLLLSGLFRRKMMNLSSFRFMHFSAFNATRNDGNNNNSSSSRIYNPASKLNSDQFVYDRNAHLKRPIFVEQEKFGKLPVICEKALPEDDNLLIDFYVTHFAFNEPLNATLKHTPEEARELMTALIKESTDNFIIRDNDKIIAGYTLKKGYLNEQPRKKLRLEDYGQLVDSGPFLHRKNNIITTLLEASECNIYDKMEPPCAFYYGMMGSLHPNYLGQKIAEITLKALMKFCISEGARYYIGDNTGDGIAKLYCKLPGFEIIDKYNYRDFKVHGKSVIEKLVDGSQNTSVIFCDFENCKNVYLKD